MPRAVDKRAELFAPPIFIFALHVLLQPVGRASFVARAISYERILEIPPNSTLFLFLFFFLFFGREGTGAKAMPYPLESGLGLGSETLGSSVGDTPREGRFDAVWLSQPPMAGSSWLPRGCPWFPASRFSMQLPEGVSSRVARLSDSPV